VSASGVSPGGRVCFRWISVVRDEPDRALRHSVAVGADDFAVSPGAERPVGLQADTTFDEMHAAVYEREVGSSRVVGGGVHNPRPRQCTFAALIAG
jgi:hypothetical protein